jgi:hypothetical protein
MLPPKNYLLLLIICLGCLAGNAQLPFGKGIRILSPKFFPGWQGQHVSYPFVAYDTAMGRFRMYYAGSSSTQVNESLWDQWVTGVATSRNSLDWVGPDDYEQVLFARKFLQGDVVNPDEQTKIFDAVFAIDACVVKDGSGYKCWYTGWNGDIEHIGGGISKKKNFRIGYATSADGLSWTKFAGNAGAGAVVSTGKPGEKDVYGVEDPYVIKENWTYRMWYVAWDGNTRQIHYATSADGVNWVKKGLVLHAGVFSEQETQNPVIFRRAGQYELWYQGRYDSSKQTHIGRATSIDGISWKKSNDITLNPTAPERAGRYSPWTSVSPAQDGNLVLGNVIVLPDNSCQVFYAKQYTVSRDLTYGTRRVPLSFIYTERINP